MFGRDAGWAIVKGDNPSAQKIVRKNRLINLSKGTGRIAREFLQQVYAVDQPVYVQATDGQMDEMPERTQSLFARGDANQDGILTQDELRKLAVADSAAAQRKERGERR